ncbi:hypothetical protein, partial [Pilimelia terevasa]|uniref:hypothetical protein n=1 Tax=Pilimelia terevasa TaxID=53372 RepID=UPI003571238E
MRNVETRPAAGTAYESTPGPAAGESMGTQASQVAGAVKAGGSQVLGSVQEQGGEVAAEAGRQVRNLAQEAGSQLSAQARVQQER